MSRAAKEIMDETKEKLRECVDSLWYKSYPSPKDYERTYELLNSVNGRIVKNGIGNYRIEVYLDPNLISSNPNSHGWGQHAGFSGIEFTEGLINSIIHGMGGSTNNPRYGESTNVIEVVQQEASKYANKILRKYL